MRRLRFFLVFALAFLAYQGANSQTIFQENFNGGAALSNWTLFNVDARTPAAAVAYVTDAWVIREDFDSTAVGDSAAVSTSWYTPAGAADDYMITPMIITQAGSILEFDAKAQDPAFPDGYEVRISTTTPTVAGLLANPALFSVASENASWTRRSLSLSGYPNDTIYIGWRNNSNDDFLLLIDNVIVFEPSANDAGISLLNSPASGCGLGTADSVTVTITNFGSNALTSVPLSFRFNNGTAVNETYTGNIAAGNSDTYTFSQTVNVGTAGSYNIQVYTGLVGDGNNSNDTLNTTISNNLTALPYSENFDALIGGLTGLFPNGWEATATGVFEWRTNIGPTTSVATGPASDHTTGSGTYLYTEASAPATPGEIAFLTSPCIDLSSNPVGLSMEFWYHMFGADIGTLYIEVDNSGNWVRIDSIVGPQQVSNADAYQSKVVGLTSYLNQSELRVRFVTARGASFNGDVAIDDVRFFTPFAVDAELASLDISGSVSNASPITISGSIKNAGSSTLTSVEVNWTVDGGTTVNTDTVSVNLASNSSAVFTHSINWTTAVAGQSYNLEVWTSNPNGVMDMNISNDSLSENLFIITGATVQKNALLEQFTTAVCQFCPDGAWVAEQIHNNYQNVYATSVHSCFGTDGMTNTEASQICTAIGINAAPTAMVDRKLFAGESDVAFGRGSGYPAWASSTWATRSLAQSTLGAPVDVNLTGSYNPTSRALNVSVSASFVDFIAPGQDVRVSLILVEDSVTGVGPQYNQVNAYNTQTGHPFAGLGNPIVGYVHKRVMRDVLPSTWGDATVIPSTIALNTAYTGTFNTTLPTGFNASNMYLIATVNYFGGANIGQYEVLNARRIRLNLITSQEEIKEDLNSFKIYPNPTDLPFTNVEFKLSEQTRIEARIMDVTGKEVVYQDFGMMSQGNQRIQLETADLDNGFYFVNFRVGDDQISKKISILK